MRLTSAQKRDLSLVAEGNMCSKSEPVPFRMMHKYVYREDGGSKLITDKMIDKLRAMGLVESAEYYRERHPDAGWTKWGRFVRITEKGSKLLGA